MNKFEVFPVQYLGQADDDYTKPSNHVATIRADGHPQGHFINAEYLEQEPMRLRPPGRAHQNGTCGGYAGLCGACYDLELKWHLRVIRRIVAKTPPGRGENVYEYAYRVRIRLVDTWHDALCKLLKGKNPPVKDFVLDPAKIAQAQESHLAVLAIFDGASL